MGESNSMSWNNILKQKGFIWILGDLWYKMFSWQSNPYSIKKYLQRNIYFVGLLTEAKKIPKFKFNTRDELVLKVFSWVVDNFEYITDEKNFNQIENWEDINVLILNKKGDCESLTTLLYCILRYYNINPLQIGFIYGGVKKYGDHVYMEYQADETMKWYVFDPAYAPKNKTEFKYRLTVDEDNKYIKKKTKISDFEIY